MMMMASFERQDSLGNKAIRKTSGRRRDLLSSEHFTKVALSLDRLQHSSIATLQTAEASTRSLCWRTSRPRFGQGTKLRHPWCHFISHHASNLQRLIDLSRKKPSPRSEITPLTRNPGRSCLGTGHLQHVSTTQGIHATSIANYLEDKFAWICNESSKRQSARAEDNRHITQLRALIPFFFKASALQDNVFSNEKLQKAVNPVIQPRNMSMLPNHEEDVASKASFWILISWSWDLTIITPSQNPIQDASMICVRKLQFVSSLLGSLSRHDCHCRLCKIIAHQVLDIALFNQPHTIHSLEESTRERLIWVELSCNTSSPSSQNCFFSALIATWALTRNPISIAPHCLVCQKKQYHAKVPGFLV